ncbi:cytosolic phospholipase A2 delta-like [Spea bombifrons]|uniref:cytosolic phospholipase A2 delta-like n=1 Tax=Spea bombifrons TaxID=233779 RepID=UPI002349D288|nr:cytosolic phospholipase A2 delta-like [Spea bombifrons]
MAEKLITNIYQEESAIHMLSVKVVQARNIPWADWMSNADCYVSIWLPTCTNRVLKTKTLSNTSDPKWDETFHFKICEKVQNLMHLSLHDEDVVSKNDLLYTVVFDVGKVPIGETMKTTFPLNPEGKESLDVEFTRKTLPAHPEKILTNSVLVSRSVSCLDVSVDKQKIPEHFQGKTIVLTVEDSCEKNNELVLDPGSDHIDPCTFHCIRKWDPELTVHLEGTNAEDADGLTKVPFNSLSVGKEERIELPAPPGRSLELNLKVEECTDKLDVRLGYDLCEDEKIFLQNRSKMVAAALKKVLKLDRDLEDHEVPVIAVTTTGGGTRAMTSLYGTLSGLKKMNLLDAVSYITGASGSTWCMSKLYEDPDWSQKDLTKPIKEARKSVTDSKRSAFSLDRLSFYREEMEKRAKMGYKASFTDLWGLLLESMYHDGLNDTKLSDQRKALNHGQNPLPLCLAMNVKDIEKTTLDFKEWCEFSPYEVGLLKYGAFIRAEDFGSQFFMGRLTKRLPESRLCYLQGLWSNIFSINLMDAWVAAVSSEHFWYRFTRDTVYNLDEEEFLAKKRAESGLETRLYEPTGVFSSTVKNILTNRPIDGEHHNFVRGLQIHKDYAKQKGFNSFKDTQLDQSPNQLTPFTDDLCLVDSAYYINASFPSLLREERKVDIILSFDYGLSGHFKSVEQTKSYCTNQKLPFPNIELSDADREHPKECHVFSDPEDPEAPVILHFPLVNDSFKKYKAPGVSRSHQELEDGVVHLNGMWSPYTLVKLTYSERNFDKLLNLAEYNVMNSEELILQALRDAIAHKQKSRNTGAN